MKKVNLIIFKYKKVNLIIFKYNEHIKIKIKIENVMGDALISCGLCSAGGWLSQPVND